MFLSNWRRVTRRTTHGGGPARRAGPQRRNGVRLGLVELEGRLTPVTWNSTSLQLIGPERGGTVTPNGHFFAANGFEIYRSLDQGATWQAVTQTSSFASGPIAYAPSNPMTMISGDCPCSARSR